LDTEGLLEGTSVADEIGTIEAELPTYVIEGARSARSKCKTCRRKIDKDALRLGILIQGPYGTGYLWHHLKCAARRQFDKLEEAYAQEAWKAAKVPPRNVPPLETLEQYRRAAEERRKARKELPHVEVDPSGRARCKHCNEPIEKGTMRVVLARAVYFGTQVRMSPINVHPRCVAAELHADDCGTEAEGFAEALRAHSADQPAEKIEAVLAEIGELL
jgi:hypothetical protein